MRLLVIILLISSLPTLADVKVDITLLHEESYTLSESDPDRMFEIGVITEKMAHDAGLAFEEANSLFIQAWVQEVKRLEKGKAFVNYLKCIEIMRPVFEDTPLSTKIYAKALLNIGNILADHNSFDEALKYYEESEKILTDHHILGVLTKIHWAKSKVYGAMGSYDKALKCLESALETSTEYGVEYMIISTYNKRSILEIESGNPKDALNTCSIVYNYDFKNASVQHWQELALINTGYAYLEIGDFKAAAESFKKSIKLGSEKDIRNYYVSHLNLCEAYLKLEKYDLAETTGLRALEYFDRVALVPEFYSLFNYLADVSFMKGDFAQSRAYAQRYVEENEKFLAMQEELINVRDQYKMEMLAAGFFMSSNTSARSESTYMFWLTIISSAFTIILLAGISREYLIRRSIRKAIHKINKDSPI